jgi:hypothetical protein
MELEPLDIESFNMTDVDELVALFQAMDDEAKQYTLATARARAKRCPARRHLQLVASQLGNGPLRSELSGLQDVGLPPISCPPVLV